MPPLSLAENYDHDTDLSLEAKKNPDEKPPLVLLDQDADEEVTHIVDVLMIGHESTFTESELNTIGEMFMNDYNEIYDGSNVTITSVIVEVKDDKQVEGRDNNNRRNNYFVRGRSRRSMLLSMRTRWIRAADTEKRAKDRGNFRSQMNPEGGGRDLSSDDAALFLENFSFDLLECFPDIKFMEIFPEE